MNNEPRFRIGDTLLTHLNELVLIDDIGRAKDEFINQYIYLYNAKGTNRWYDESSLRHFEKYTLQNDKQE